MSYLMQHIKKCASQKDWISCKESSSIVILKVSYLDRLSDNRVKYILTLDGLVKMNLEEVIAAQGSTLKDITEKMLADK
jgi:hypothetical protein